MQDVAIVLVEIDAFLDDRLAVGVERNAARIVGAGVLEAARLDQQRIVAAVAVLIDPLADRVAREHRVRRHVLGPVAAVGMDAAIVVDVLNQDVRGVRRDDDFHRRIGVHDAWHAGRQAPVGRINALSALRLIGEVPLIDGLIFSRQRGFLQPAGRLGRVVAADAARAVGAHPLALQVGIFRIVPRLRVEGRHTQRRRERDGSDKASMKHGGPPGKNASGRDEANANAAKKKAVDIPMPADGMKAAAKCQDLGMTRLQLAD